MPEHEGTVKYPGAPYKFSKSPIRMWRRPPLLGEHNIEILAEMGFSKDDLVDLARDGII